MRRGFLGGVAAAAFAAAASFAAINPIAFIRAQAEYLPGRRIRRTETPRLSRLNRSRHWLYAETYKQARAMSPTPWTPVR